MLVASSPSHPGSCCGCGLGVLPGAQLGPALRSDRSCRVRAAEGIGAAQARAAQINQGRGRCLAKGAAGPRRPAQGKAFPAHAVFIRF